MLESNSRFNIRRKGSVTFVQTPAARKRPTELGDEILSAMIINRYDTGETVKPALIRGIMEEELQARFPDKKNRKNSMIDDHELKIKRNSGPVKLKFSNLETSIPQQIAKTPKAGARNRLVEKARNIKTASVSGSNS